MLTMIALGFSSGFPLLLVFGTLNLWLKDAGISYAAIGLFSLVKTPYSFKWAWSPIIDRIRLPLFCRLGRRRGWAFFIQIILLFSILGMSTVEPAATPFTMAFSRFWLRWLPLRRTSSSMPTALKASTARNRAPASPSLFWAIVSDWFFPVQVPFGWLPPWTGTTYIK